MSVTTREPTADPLFAGHPPRRPAYATGVLLDAGDFLDEQSYHRGRLARAVWALTGGGTIAGLRVSHRPEQDGREEEIRVAGGLAVDRLGRLVEVPRTACLRLPRWWSSTFAADDGDTLQRASYEDPGRFVGSRVTDLAGSDERPPIPARAVVADVFLRFIACEEGRTPAFASGPFDALDASTVSRLRDAYELLLVPREGLDDDFDGLPPRAELPGDPAERREAVEDAVLDGWPGDGMMAGGSASPLPEHPLGIDPTAIFVARILVPVGAGEPVERDGEAVVVDNWTRRFVPSIRLLQQLIGT